MINLTLFLCVFRLPPPIHPVSNFVDCFFFFFFVAAGWLGSRSYLTAVAMVTWSLKCICSVLSSLSLSPPRISAFLLKYTLCCFNLYEKMCRAFRQKNWRGWERWCDKRNCYSVFLRGELNVICFYGLSSSHSWSLTLEHRTSSKKEVFDLYIHTNRTVFVYVSLTLSLT